MGEFAFDNFAFIFCPVFIGDSSLLLMLCYPFEDVLFFCLEVSALFYLDFCLLLALGLENLALLTDWSLVDFLFILDSY